MRVVVSSPPWPDQRAARATYRPKRPASSAAAASLRNCRKKLTRGASGQPRRPGRCRQDPPGASGPRPTSRAVSATAPGWSSSPTFGIRRWSATPYWPPWTCATRLRPSPARCCSPTCGTRSCCWWWTTASTCSTAAAWLVDGRPQAAPGVRVLATSREPLSVAGRARRCRCRRSTLPGRAPAAAARPGAPERGGARCSPSGRRLRPARLRADRRQPGGRGRAVPPARRAAAGDRAGGGPDARPRRRSRSSTG